MIKVNCHLATLCASTEIRGLIGDFINMTKKIVPSSHEEYSSEIVFISPKEASAWLTENKFDNRRLDDRNVNKIARDIKNGKWVFDGTPIRFDKEGNIIDGQHRLWAIVTAGKQVECLVIRGLDNKAKITIDSGKSRSLSDIFHFNGYVNNNVLASVCRLAIGWRTTNGNMWKWATDNSHKRLSAQEMLEEANNNSLAILAVQNSLSLKMVRKIMGPGMAAFSYYLFLSTGAPRHEVDDFFLGIEKGIGLSVNSPILLLRNTLTIRDTYLYAAEKQGGNKSMAYKLAIIIKAWNALKEKKSLQRLRFDNQKENYPLPL